MKKYLIAGALALALPALSMAATFSNVAFENGDVTVSGQGGATVNATFRLTVPASQTVEFVEVDVLGDSLAPVETSVGGELGLQEGTHDVTVPVKLPPNTGTYTLQVKGAGIFGGIRSINAADGVVAGPTSFSNAVRVTADSTVTGSTPSSWQTALTALQAQIAAIVAALHPVTPPAPTASATCTAYAQAKVGAQYGVVNSANVAFQGFLLSQHASIPALAAGASFGFWGPQTQAADVWFQSMNHCV